MAIRIVGVDIPQNKRGEIALTYIYGIGRSSAAKILDKAGVMALAEIPSKEVLLARFLGSIQGPLSGFARAIQAVIDQGNEAVAAQ